MPRVIYNIEQQLLAVPQETRKVSERVSNLLGHCGTRPYDADRRWMS